MRTPRLIATGLLALSLALSLAGCATYQPGYHDTRSLTITIHTVAPDVLSRELARRGVRERYYVRTPAGRAAGNVSALSVWDSAQRRGEIWVLGTAEEGPTAADVGHELLHLLLESTLGEQPAPW